MPKPLALAVLLAAVPLLAAGPLPAPQIFAPGVISGPANDGAPTFTPDGKTLYFERGGGSWTFILTSRKTGDAWSAPEIAPFSGQWSDSQPALSPDGSRLVFQSSRPSMRESALWEVERRGAGWSDPVRLPATVNFTARVFKPSLAADGTLYFMAQPKSDATWRLYRCALVHGAYAAAEPLAFSDGAHGDVDPAIAPDQSFLIFSSSGRAAADDAHEHLYLVRRAGAGWGAIVPLRYDDDYAKNPADDGEANLSPDLHTLYFISGRTVHISPARTRAEAAADFARVNAWDNSNNNVWTLPL